MYVCDVSICVCVVFLCRICRELTNVYNFQYYNFCICLLGNDFSKFIKYWNLVGMFSCVFISYFWDRMGGLCLITHICLCLLCSYCFVCLFILLDVWGAYVRIQRNICFHLNKWTRAYIVPCHRSFLIDN